MLTNSIVSGNTAPVGGPDIWNNAASLTREGANIIRLVTSVGGYADSGPPAITADPLLSSLGNYGGPTKTMPPVPGSPALDAGSNAGASGLTIDQRGNPRLASTRRRPWTG